MRVAKKKTIYVHIYIIYNAVGRRDPKRMFT